MLIYISFIGVRLSSVRDLSGKQFRCDLKTFFLEMLVTHTYEHNWSNTDTASDFELFLLQTNRTNPRKQLLFYRISSISFSEKRLLILVVV